MVAVVERGECFVWFVVGFVANQLDHKTNQITISSSVLINLGSARATKRTAKIKDCETKIESLGFEHLLESDQNIFVDY